MTNNTNIENNGSGYYGLKIQDFDNRLCEMFSVASITKDGSESFDKVTDALMDGLETQIKILLGNEINVPFIFCLLNEKGGFIGNPRGFSKKDFKEALNNDEDIFLKNEYIPGKMFLPTYKPNHKPASPFLINRQWSASSVLIYWNSTEDKEKFDKSFGNTIDKFNKSKEQIQFIGTYGSEDTVKKYMLNWGGIHSVIDIKQEHPCINISNLFSSKQIEKNETENNEIQKHFLKAIAFLLQQTFKSSSDFSPSSASTSNECYIFFIPSVFDSNCRTGLLLFLLNPDKVLKISTQKSKKTVQNGITLDELYQKLLMITRAWGLTTERQLLNHKNSRTQFQAIQEQADLFAEKITPQTLEQYLKQAFQSKPEFKNRICFLDLLFCNPDESNSNNTRVTITNDENRFNEDLMNQGEQILNPPSPLFIHSFNKDNSLDIIKSMSDDDSPNDSFNYWESSIDYNNDEAITWSLYVNTIKNHKDELKSNNNHNITHVAGIPFFDQNKKYIAGVLVGFASNNNVSNKDDNDFNKNFIEWLHLIIRQLTSAYIINTNRAIDQERSNFATAAYRIGHPLKDRTTLIGSPLNTIQDWLDDNAETYNFSDNDRQKLQLCIDKIRSLTELISGFGHVLNIISNAIKKTEKKEDVFLTRNKKWTATNPYNIRGRIKDFVTNENSIRKSNNNEIEICFSFSDNPVIIPWICQTDGACYRPFDLIYDEIFRETLLNARTYGKADSSIDNDVQKKVIKIDVRQEVINIDNLSKDKYFKNCLVFSNKSKENEIDIKESLKLTKDWVHPLRCKPGGGIIWLTTLLEVTNIGIVNLRYNNGYFETAFYLNGMTND